ncbi:MAG: peptidoglycan DD-metalloendopeptidase family protein [Thermoleophilaceae bacterium]|nr:peptidoglycan DD-metalloendopeptidase family protein [Thermoleophilaceae bacterium]
MTLQSADGNHVILRIGPRRYVGYVHLRPGSVRVGRGQRVRRGQVIGQLGNTGSSSGPHLHVQVMNGPSIVFSRWAAVRVRSVPADGQVPAPDRRLLAAMAAGQSIAIETSGAGPRPRELPVGRDVVRFPGASEPPSSALASRVGS